MKKFVAVLFAVVLVLPMFVACKKTSKTQTSEKVFSTYFPNAVVSTGERETKSTKTVFGQKQAYYSITFFADAEKTNRLACNYLKFDFSTNQEIERMDIIATITTNGTTKEYPLVALISNKTGSVTFNPNILFKDETKIEIALTIPGGNGIDGLLFDKNNAITGFTWAINSATFKAAQ